MGIALLILALSSAGGASAGDVAQTLIPQPKILSLGTGGTFPLSRSTELRISGLSAAAEEAELRESFDEIRALARRGPRSTVELVRLEAWDLADSRLGKQGYTLSVSPRRAVIEAISARGLHYGLKTLRQLARAAKKGALPLVTIKDWPDMEDRMVLYDFRFDNVNMAYTKRWIERLAEMKINQVMIFLSGDFMYSKYPFVAAPDKFTPEKLRELRRFARRHQVEIVMQVESLGHAEGVLRHEAFRDLRLKDDNVYAYSPCAERTYQVLDDFYAELAPESDLELFHVGGDEVWDFDQDPRCREEIARVGQAGVYSRHMMRLKSLLAARGRKMAVWGDMLLKHPEAARGFARDTVIFDWDYSEDHKRFDRFPTLARFKDLGFKRIYATSAVLGFDDIYPIYPTALRNIHGLTRAALREGILSSCVTMWQMQPGNSAENYFYGVAWAADVFWNSQSAGLKDFNRRFAGQWMGIDDPGAAAHVDRAVWFPWRVSGSSLIGESDVGGFWQTQFASGRLLYEPFDGFVGRRTRKQLEELSEGGRQLSGNIRAASRSVDWLARRVSGGRTPLVDSMRMSLAFHSYVAEKAGALAGIGLARSPSERRVKLEGLSALGSRLSDLKQHLRRAVDERNRHPEELSALQREVLALSEFRKAAGSGRTPLVPLAEVERAPGAVERE